MKRLISENQQGIDWTKKTVTQLAANLNQLLKSWVKHNYWNVQTDVWELVSNPIGYYDAALLKNSSIKPTKGLTPNPEKIAETLGADRTGFINSIQATIPSSGGYGHAPRVGLIQLSSNDRNLFDYINDQFVINLIELEKRLDTNRVYAETKEQIEFVEYWEGFANALNLHVKKGYASPVNLSLIAQNLGLKFDKEFKVNYQNLANEVKKLN